MNSNTPDYYTTAAYAQHPAYTVNPAYLRSVAKRHERGALFLSALCIGLAIILMTFLSLNAYQLTVSIAGALKINTDNVYFEGVQYIFSISLWMLTAFIIACAVRRRRLSDTVLAGRPKSAGLFFGAVLFCCLGMAFGNMLTGFFIEVFPRIDNPILYDNSNIGNISELTEFILYSAALPALVEEFCFRGVVLGLLRPHGRVFAIVGSSVMFSLIHGNFVQMPFTLVLGLFFGYAVEKTGSIWPSVTAHFINNAISCVSSYVTAGMDTADINAWGIALYGSWIILGIAGALILLFCSAKSLDRRRPRGFSPENGGQFFGAPAYSADTVMVTPQRSTLNSLDRIFVFWLNPGVLICAAYYIWLAVRCLI